MRLLQKIILVGPMGAGKSTLGKLLAKELKWPYFDNDAEMTTRYGISQAELASMPVEELHKIESRYLADVIAQDIPLISGAAASVVDYSENLRLLETVTTIYLRIPLSDVLNRAGSTGVGRQALAGNGLEILTERYNRRDPLYRSVSVFTLELSHDVESDSQRLLEVVKNS